MTIAEEGPARFLERNYGRKLTYKGNPIGYVHESLTGRLVGYSLGMIHFYLIIDVESSHGFICWEAGDRGKDDHLHPDYTPPSAARFTYLRADSAFEFEVDRRHYPHDCLRCRQPAYVGAVPAATDCSNAKCPTRTR